MQDGYKHRLAKIELAIFSYFLLEHEQIIPKISPITKAIQALSSDVRFRILDGSISNPFSVEKEHSVVLPSSNSIRTVIEVANIFSILSYAVKTA